MLKSTGPISAGVFAVLVALLAGCACPPESPQPEPRRNLSTMPTSTTGELRIRDPFLLFVPDENCYYLFGTNDVKQHDPKCKVGFDCYRSSDLTHWNGPAPAFRPDADFWATQDYWAPEVYPYRGKYYMFATFKSPERRRGTQVLIADWPEGPYRPWSDGPVTPADWECLDGTLYRAKDGTPWIVFCHEWLQITDGAICAMPLTDDLRSAAGEPITLFHASEAPWARAQQNQVFVTDGPFLIEADGRLFMLWSSFGDEGYAMGIAESADGSITGPWRQHAEPLYAGNGGHGMIFRTADGSRQVAIHSPNTPPQERLLIFPLPLDKLTGQP